MTLEEAAEIILGGELWVRCKACDGTYADDCLVCEDSHAELDPSYREALQTLRLPPPPIWRTTVSDGITHRSGPTVFYGKFPVTRHLSHIKKP